MSANFRPAPFAWVASCLVAALLLTSCGGGDPSESTASTMRRALASTTQDDGPVLTGTWTQLPNPSAQQDTGPYGRAWTEMTWDTARQEMVIFGGNSTIEYANDIWSYNAGTAQWTKIDPNVLCPGNSGFDKINGTDDSAFRYDPVNGGYWVFGGTSGYRCLTYAQTRTAAAGSAPDRIVDPALSGPTVDAYANWYVRSGGQDVAVVGYDPSTKQLLVSPPLTGMAAGVSYQLYASTTGGSWYFDPVSRKWTGLETPAGYIGPTPGTRTAAAVAYSDVDEAFILVGGSSVDGADMSVWRLDVRTRRWTQMPTPSGASPTPVREMLNSMVYDKANDVFVMFGGLCTTNACSGVSGKTWVYKLSTNTWTDMAPAVAPPARAKHLMSYDATHGVVVIFAGQDETGLLNDTWYYHYPSNKWRKLSIDGSPPARYLSQVAYDPVRRRTVVYGGSFGSSIGDDIWALSLNTPPQVSLTAPAAGAAYDRGTDITLAADASDPSGEVAKVEFFANGLKVGESASAPYTIVWRGAVPSGYAMTAVATDNQGASTTSSAVNVTVAGSYQPPTAALGAIVGDTAELYGPANISLTANVAAGEAPVWRVEFFVGNAKIGESTAAPYRTQWLNVASGTYAVRTVVTDVRGAQTVSPAMTVTVRDRGRPMLNVALAANGATATASSTYSTAFPVASVIDGARNSAGWGSGTGGWNDGTAGTYPDWVQVDFAGVRTISHIRVYTLQDAYTSATDPALDTPFTRYGVQDFNVQYWTGSAWADVPGGAVTGNSLVWRNFSFPAITTSRIRVLITSALGGYSRIAEVEAWAEVNANAAPNVALTSPAAGGSYTAPAQIALAANASDSDGSIARVEFYAGSTKIGEATSAPYTLTWSAVPAGSYTLSALAVDNVGAQTASASVNVTVQPAAASSVNVALASNGGVASASSLYPVNASYPSNYSVSSINDGVIHGRNWSNGGGWNDNTANTFPDWVQVTFAGQRTIDRIEVTTLSDNFATDTDPTTATTFSRYGITSYDVQYWNGSAWATVPNGSVSGNSLVRRSFGFSAVTTDRIRIVVNAGLAGYSRIVEVQAWSAGGGSSNAAPNVALTSPAAGGSYTAPAQIALAANASDSDGSIARVEFYAGSTKIGEATSAPYTLTWSAVPAGSYTLSALAVDNVGAQTASASVNVTVQPAAASSVNVALASNGGVASASSLYPVNASYPSNYSVSSINDGVIHGRNWSNGGGWNDNTANTFPDWVQVTFAGQRTIDRIEVTTLSDNFATDTDPTTATTFSRYGITSYDVQYWNGSAWATVPNGSVSGNSLVRRSFGFSAVTTDRIRIVVNAGLAGYSRIVEVQAWSAGGGSSNAAPNVALTSPAAGGSYTAPAQIALAANASDSDGSIARVEFYAGSTKIGEATSAPYTLTWSAVPAGSYTLSALAVDNAGAQTASSSVNVTVQPAAASSVNVALASNGGVASASSLYPVNASYPSNYSVSSINDGVIHGRNWSNGGGWNDNTANTFPDWVQVTFAGQRTIDRIEVTTLSDNFATDTDPTTATTFSRYGITSYDVQYWNGSAWATVPNGSVSGNSLVRRSFGFSAVTTDRIRIVVNAGLAGYSRIVEVQAWSAAP